MINEIIIKIADLNPLHGKKLKKQIKLMDEAFFLRANDFLKRYEVVLKNDDKDFDYAIDCYLRMLGDITVESIVFMETGKYSSSSFEEVNARVYNNPEIMEYYMHGLLLSQFLFFQHYDVLLYFNNVIAKNKPSIKRYLEVGGGHGLYISEAISIIGDQATFDVVDISKSSIELAKKMVQNDAINYYLSDVFVYEPEELYDFIVMGEVLEHVENPKILLEKLGSFLNENGKLFITTPTNAPAIDHIYLFNNEKDIDELIYSAGFVIEDKLCVFSEKLPPELCEKYKVSLMYASVLTKRK